MYFRARLSLFALETRENPSVPGIDPTGGVAPAPVSTTPVTTTTPPTTTTTTDPTTIALGAVTAGATVPATNVFTAVNPIYNTPVVASGGW